jgi:DNA modification methylase
MQEPNEFQNTLFTHDNLFVLHGMNSEIADLIYLDPPFNSKRMYSGAIGSKAAGTSFKDMWTWEDINEAYLETMAQNHVPLVKYIRTIADIHSKAMMSYILYMAQRLLELHRILKDTGSIYLHCDPTASHYLKQLLDYIFGKNNFRNEIVWCYSNSGRSKKKFATKHDVILCYAKSENFHWDYKIPVGEKYLQSHYKQVDENGNICRIRIDHGKKRIYYPTDGMTCNDWWCDIPSLNSQAMERTGYPTQKPLALLHRIIEASSKAGDVVLDPFCGCATTCVAAQQLGRKWIGIDIEKKAVEVLIERLESDGHIDDTSQQGLKFKEKGVDFIHLVKPTQRTDIQIEEITPQTKSDIKKRLFKQQEGHCNGCNTVFEIHHFEIDHIVPKSKGGGDYFENYQLLCSSCNRTKGARPMEYLNNKIKMRQRLLDEKYTFGE